MGKVQASSVLYLCLGLSTPWISATEMHSGLLEQGKNKPLADLPKGVQAEKGKVTLYADFANAKNGRITLYLINRSGKVLPVPAQDGDPYAKLEARNAEGGWERAQPHVYSWCGNSYMEPHSVGDESFMVIGAPYPTEGEKRPVRYRMFSDVGAVSNEGEGHVDTALIATSRYDAMAIRYGDVKVVEHVLYSTPKTDEDKWPDLRGSAIRRLEYLPPAEATPLLKTLLIEIGLKDRYYRDVIRIMSKVAPKELASYAKEVFSEGPSPRRDRLRSAPGYLEDPGTFALIKAQVLDPATPDAEGFIYGVTRKPDEESRSLLSTISEGTAYRQNLRYYARYLTEQRFGKLPLKVEMRPASGDWDWKTTRIEVVLTNEREEDVSLSYTRPEQIVGFWVYWYSPPPERMIRFVPIREAARFFQGEDGQKPTRVVLHKGEKHTLQFDLLSYFDFSGCDEGKKEGFLVTPRIFVPGVQKEPAAWNGGTAFQLP